MVEIYKETEIGLIPEDWDLKSVEEVSLINESSLKKDSELEFIEYIDIASVDKGIVNVKQHLELNEAPSRAKRIVKDNDILISTVRPNLKHYAFIYNANPNTIASTGFAVISAKKINPNFLYYYLTTDKYTNYLTAIADSHTSAYPSFNPDIIEKSYVPFPSKDEQNSIAKILSDLDSKIQINQKMNQTLEEIGQAIFKHWFVHFEFPNEEGKPYKSSGGEMVDSDLGEIPKGWEVQEIGNVIETTGGGTPSTKKEEYWENGDIQWFSPRDITANRQMFISNSEKMINTIGLGKSSAKLFPPHSLMLTSRATVGELSINSKEACTNQGFITCIPNERLSTFYLYYWIKMNKEYIISLASGSTFREISKSTFRSLKIVISDKDVLKYYNSLLGPIFNQIQNLQLQNKELSQIRDSLLPKLMSGKIRVNISKTEF